MRSTSRSVRLRASASASTAAEGDWATGEGWEIPMKSAVARAPYRAPGTNLLAQVLRRRFDHPVAREDLVVGFEQPFERQRHLLVEHGSLDDRASTRPGD